MTIVRNEKSFFLSERKINNEKKHITSLESSKISEKQSSKLQNCLICFEKPPDSVFMECGHGGNIN